MGESNRTVSIEYIVSDDDITMRSHLTHATNNFHGKLSLHIPHPYFLADPSHRINVMCKEVFKLALASKTFLQLYAKRIAPVEHLFGCYEWCDVDWCFDKELDDMQDIVIWSQNDNKMTENGKNINKGGEYSHNSATNDTSSSNSD